MTLGQRLARARQGFAHTRASQLYRLSGRLKGVGCLLVTIPLTACFSSVDGAPQDQLPEPVEHAARAQLCAGRTAVADTPWQADKDGVVHVDIDTSHCGLGGDPLYFTSLGGETSHWAARGATSIFRSSATGFRVVVMRREAPRLADNANWYVNWMARSSGVRSQGLCTGRTSSNAFKQYEDGGVSVRVDLGDCGFEAAPVVLTSLGGFEGHAATRGVTSTYGVTPDHFTVFIQKPGITVEQAAAWGWHINWSASPPSSDNGDYCTGKSTLTDTVWEQYGASGLSTHLKTADCQAPLVFTTLSGDRSHWYTTGASSIYGADASGFRIFVNRSRVTPSFAADNGWHVHWTRVSPTSP